MRQEAVAHLAGCVFQPRCRSVELIESAERGIEVSLVVEFAAADQIAVERHEGDLAPLGLEAVSRGSTDRMSDDRPEIAQLVHGLDAVADVGNLTPGGAGIGND